MIRIIGPGAGFEELNDFVADVAEAGCDVLVVNALRKDEKVGIDDLQDVLFDQVCVEELVDCFAHIATISPELRDGSRIIFLVPGAFLGGVGCTHLATSAAMLVGLARSLALEFAERGISVNCLAPGQDAKLDAIKGEIAFLLEEEAADVTGQVILIDRGENLSLRKAGRRVVS